MTPPAQPNSMPDWPIGQVGACLFEPMTGVTPHAPDAGQDSLPGPLAALAKQGRLYAVLDVASMTGLIEILDAFGMEYRRIHSPDSPKDWQSLGPVVVRMQVQSGLNRVLFTDKGPKAEGCFWRRSPAGLLRVDAEIDTVAAHLMRYTRLTNAEGDGFYVRFWERHVLPGLAQDGAPLAESLLEEIGGQPVHWLLLVPAAESAMQVSRVPERIGRPVAGPRLSAEDRASMERSSELRKLREEIGLAVEDLPPQVAEAYGADPRLADLWRQLRPQGYYEPQQRVRALALYLRAVVLGQNGPAWATLTQEGTAAEDRLARLNSAVKSLEAARQG